MSRAKVIRKLAIAAGAFALSAGAAYATCVVEDNGKQIILGRFKYAYAYGDCVKVYQNHYLKKLNDGNSELYLRCEGSRQKIAMVKDFQFLLLGVNVAGCAIPKTMG